MIFLGGICMRIKQLMQIIKKDDRKLGDIFQKSINSVDRVNYNPICGIEEKEDNLNDMPKVLRKAEPLENIHLHEISSSD